MAQLLGVSGYVGLLGHTALIATTATLASLDLSSVQNWSLALVYLAKLAPWFVLWMAGRTALAQQVRLAANARAVLQTMTAATRGSAVPKAKPQALLLRNLPWLPAYDRRDVLVVHELLTRSRSDLSPARMTVHALALSAYAAARQCVSPGDSSAAALTLREWLAERGMGLFIGPEGAGLYGVQGLDSTSASAHIMTVSDDAEAAIAKEGSSRRGRLVAQSQELRAKQEGTVPGQPFSSCMLPSTPSSPLAVPRQHSGMCVSTCPPPRKLRQGQPLRSQRTPVLLLSHSTLSGSPADSSHPFC